MPDAADEAARDLALASDEPSPKGNDEGGAHSDDAGNLMSPGSIRNAGTEPDAGWCEKVAATAQG